MRRAIGTLLTASLAVAPAAHAEWAEVYATDGQGAHVSGEVADLERAVRDGLPIRIYWTAGPIEHSADAAFTTVFNGSVLAQIDPILAQGVDGEMRMTFADGATEWRAMFSTDGTLTSVRTGQETRVEPMAMRWFVDWPDAPAMDGGLERVVVADGLASPWGLAFIDADTALVTEKEGGLVRVDLRDGAKTAITGLPEDLRRDIRSEHRFDNGGLFDVALDPDFAATRWVYISYSAASGTGSTTKIVRARISGDALTDMQTLYVASPYTEGEFFHYGGGLVFGADGKLYATIGERLYHERDNPPVPVAQDPTDRRGKILRLNPDGSIPADNPDFGEGSAPGLYARGIRAAQGLALHPATGEILFSEHGSTRGDELNRLSPEANYGWPLVTEGGYRSEDYMPPPADGLALEGPVWSWPHTVAPTGLAFYEGDKFPGWKGDLLVSGLSRGSLWRMRIEGGEIVAATEMFTQDRMRSRDVAVAPDGAVYMLSDTLLSPDGTGGLDYTSEPGGQLLAHPACPTVRRRCRIGRQREARSGCINRMALHRHPDGPR